jgi:pimeloyl-ACP methyl ester carboxylesterase
VTLFIDLRASASGGVCAREASIWDDGTQPVSVNEFAARVRGRDLVLATHGFNVGRSSGINALSHWEQRFSLAATSSFVGVLWPGDSRYLPVIDYPFEGDEAIASGKLLAQFLNQQAGDAASITFVSHSLGARTMLQALSGLNRPARRLILLAGAIENDCLAKEYQAAAANVQQIFVMASTQDRVLQLAFPIGNPIGDIVMHGHPYFRTALGRHGPAQPIADAQRGGVWQIPDGWEYGHSDYLPHKTIGQSFPMPLRAPAALDAVPSTPAGDEWKPAWSACAVSSQMI